MNFIKKEIYSNNMNKNCFHCNLNIPDKTYLPIKYKGKEYNTCCLGCQAVTNSIIKSGLEKYYEQRTKVAKRVTLPNLEILEQIKLYDEQKLQSDFTTIKNNDNNIKQIILIVNLITCPACIWLIEQHLINTDGIISAEINYTNYKAKISWNNNKIKLSDILLKIRQIGYKAYPYETQKYMENNKKEKKTATLRLLVASLSMMQVMMYTLPTYFYKNIGNNYLYILQFATMVLTLPVVFYSAIPFYKGTIRDLKNKTIGMDTPITISIILAFISSFIALIYNKNNAIFFDSISMLVFFLLCGRYLEQNVRKKIADSTEKLAKLIPIFCHKVESSIKNNNIIEFLVANLSPNDLILVKPGENFPVDGLIVKGSSEVNESIMTGESIPVIKNINNKVIAGTTNIINPLIVKVTNVGKNSKLGNIIKLIDFNLSKKPKIAQISNKYASIFLLCILLLSILVFIIWLYKTNITNAIWITISMLIITCPCSLSLATPTALIATTSNLASNGLLIRTANSIEILPKITDIVFDKTGTLTEGNLIITKEFYLKGKKKDLLNIIYSLEKYSEHPSAKAFSKFKNLKQLQVTQIKNIIGKGIEGMINDEKWYLGTLKFLEQISKNKLPNKFDDDNTIIALGKNDGIYAVFYLKDKIKKQSFELINKLKQLNLSVHLLSGDTQNTVKQIANLLKINFFKSRVSPSDKLNYIKNLQTQKKYVLNVGDGVNDAPALAQADVSIAVDKSTDISRCYSDLIMIKNDMNLIYKAIIISKKTLRIINQNFLWAILYNTIAIPIAIMGLSSPAISALGMSISSLLVVLNALRLLK